MASTFLDITGLSHFLDKLRLLIVQSDWAQADTEEMDFIKNKPTISVDEQTLVLTGWGNSATTSYTVTFMLNDGTQTVYDTQTVVSGGTASAPATNPTRTNYAFAGWYEDSAGTTVFTFSTPITADKTLYAKWDTQSSGSSGTITIGSYGDTTDPYSCIIGFASATGSYNYAACGSITPTAYDSSPINVLGLIYGNLHFETIGNSSLNGILHIGSKGYSISGGRYTSLTAEDRQYFINNIGNTLNWAFTPEIIIEN